MNCSITRDTKIESHKQTLSTHILTWRRSFGQWVSFWRTVCLSNCRLKKQNSKHPFFPQDKTKRNIIAYWKFGIFRSVDNQTEMNRIYWIGKVFRCAQPPTKSNNKLNKQTFHFAMLCFKTMWQSRENEKKRKERENFNRKLRCSTVCHDAYVACDVNCTRLIYLWSWRERTRTKDISFQPRSYSSQTLCSVLWWPLSYCDVLPHGSFGCFARTKSPENESNIFQRYFFIAFNLVSCTFVSCVTLIFFIRETRNRHSAEPDVCAYMWHDGRSN